MEIHKPKAAHNWREFAVEIGTIVCGILIALGLEQAVEAWHWHEVLGDEREALGDEIGHLRASMSARLELEPCYVNRLADVKEVIRRHDSSEPLDIKGPLGRPLYAPTPHPIWDLAVADQSLAHMKLAEKRRFTDVYNLMPIYDGIVADERAAWRLMQVLNHADKLTLADWSAVREAYEHAAETDQIMAGNSAAFLAAFAQLAARVPGESVRHVPPVEAFCTPMLAEPETSPKPPPR